MPRSAAASLTAFSSLLGRRILTRASLGANSKRVGWRAERSYRVRSPSATNRSAWASFSRRGSLFRGLGLLFIMAHLLFVHEPGSRSLLDVCINVHPLIWATCDTASGSLRGRVIREFLPFLGEFAPFLEERRSLGYDVSAREADNKTESGHGQNTFPRLPTALRPRHRRPLPHRDRRGLFRLRLCTGEDRIG